MAGKSELNPKMQWDSKILEKLQVGIVTAQWNSEITSRLHSSCMSTLLEHGIQTAQIEEIEVPGAFELPFGAKILMGRRSLDVVICLGCVLTGETSHHLYINQSVAIGITNLGLMTGVPVVFGVLTPDTMDQALARSGGGEHDKGKDAALTAIQMAALKKDKGNSGKKHIGFN